MTKALPLRRAVAEGLLIIVSILVAFLLDAWWDREEAQRLESQVLAAVAEEFAANLDGLDETIADNELDLGRIDRFLRTPREALSVWPADSVVLYGSTSLSPSPSDARTIMV